MPITTSTENKDYKNLLSLGITPELIDEADLPESAYKGLYKKLKIPMTVFRPRLIINSAWQLQALCGDINVFKKNQSTPDNWGNHHYHYAAWSGNKEALQWVNDNYPHHYPQLMPASDNYDRTIAHYAAWSGNKEALRWVNGHYPQLMQITHNYGKTIAHYVAWSGNKEALRWVNDYSPRLMQTRDDVGETIAHYAAWSGNKEALQWVNKHYPQLMQLTNNFGRTIAHYVAYSGNKEALQWVNEHYPQLMQLRINGGITIAHYAAGSGNKEALQWVNEHYPQLMQLTNNFGRTIAHDATGSGNKEALQWVNEHYPQLMQLRINGGITIAHYAAGSGNKEALQWVNEHYPQLMQLRTNGGRTIAHYAAGSGNKEALQWVNEHYPQLMQLRTNDGRTIVYYAALSESKDTFNKALVLSETPYSLIVPNDIDKKDVVINTLLNALEDNYTLLNVKLPDGTDINLGQKIAEKISRNLAFQNAKKEFYHFAIGFRQSTSNVAKFALEILLEIFKQMLPADIPEKLAGNTFNKLMDMTESQYRLKKSKQNILDRIENFSQSYLHVSKNTILQKINLFDSDQGKREILYQFKARIQSQNTSIDDLKNTVIDFYKENKTAIGKQRNKIHTFFSPNHQTQTAKMFQEIFNVLGIQENGFQTLNTQTSDNCVSRYT